MKEIPTYNKLETKSKKIVLENINDYCFFLDEVDIAKLYTETERRKNVRIGKNVNYMLTVKFYRTSTPFLEFFFVDIKNEKPYGYVLRLDVSIPKYHLYLWTFSYLLAENIDDLNPVAIFNNYQTRIRNIQSAQKYKKYKELLSAISQDFKSWYPCYQKSQFN